MSTRLDFAGASILPFPYPPLKDGAVATPETVASTSDPVASDDAAGAASPATANGAAPPVDGVDHAAEVAAELAKVRAEGLQRGFEEGREKGYAAGFAEGSAAGQAALVAAAERLAAIVARLGGSLTALEQPVEEAVAALALEVARRVIGGEVKRSREFLVRLIREAIAKVPLEMAAPHILLNPDDLDLVRRLVPEIGSGNATLVADESIEAGGCLVVAEGEDRPIKDRRWNPRKANGASQVNLTLASRWREVMLTLFDGEDE
jgi:flagellar assembly protein FliH